MEFCVSVCLITYNHEAYIHQAIESVLLQKINFPFEIVIGEDCSSDKTREICTQYQRKHPDKIRLLLIEKNLGIVNNFVNTVKECRGKYLAILEGDDYWTDENKLQQQVDVLESNPDIIACHHWQKKAVPDESGQYIVQEWPRTANNGYTTRTIMDAGDIFTFKMRPQTRTLVFRNILKEHPLPAWFNKVKFGDLALCLILGLYGKFYYMDEAWAVYRIHGKGASSVFSNANGYIEGNKEWMRLLAFALKEHNFQYTDQALEGFKMLLDRILNMDKTSNFMRHRLAFFLLRNSELNTKMKTKLLRYLWLSGF